MRFVLLVFHIIVTLAIIGLILLQKGEEVSAGTGGNPYNSMFSGRTGGQNPLTRATAILAILFFCSCLLMAILVKRDSQLSSQTKTTIQEPLKK